MSDARRVVIAGAGLAGLAAGLSLGRAGFDVEIFESTDRAGGKAGARRGGDVPGAFPEVIEHGFHIFPAWYTNVRHLMSMTGSVGHLRDHELTHYLVAPTMATVDAQLFEVRFGGRSLRERLTNQIHNLFNGAIPAYSMAQWSLATACLLTDRLRSDHSLDRVSYNGFLHKLHFTSNVVADLTQENALRGSAVAAYEVSAKTMQNLLRVWTAEPTPWYSLLDTDLMTGFVDPLSAAVEKVAELHLGQQVTGILVEDGYAAGLRLADGTKVHAEYTMVAVPFEVARGWMSDDLYGIGLELGHLNTLEATPMCSLHVAIREPVPDLPPGLIFLWQSPHAISAIDLNQTWGHLESRCPPTRYLTVIAANFEPLTRLSEKLQIEILLRELRHYLPSIDPGQIEGVSIETNHQTPLFINTVGSWAHRPRPTLAPFAGRPGRLVFAGDYVRNDADLACMEGAVQTGLKAAEAIAVHEGRKPGVPVLPLPAFTWTHQIGIHAAKLALWPLAIYGKLRGDPPSVIK